ncbi:MAG: nuclear transport factor 2 family protein [Acidobacteriota bacterium]
MTDTATAALHRAEAEVSAASLAWIATFNRGDFVGCSEGYTEAATMQGRPLADIQGRPAIADFWKSIVDQNPGELTYHDARVHALDPTTAVLSARWTMENLGKGLITLERWEKQADGAWLLAEDIFELAEGV